MSKKFTKLITAIALLVFMMPSLAGWGQTQNYSHIYDYSALEEMLSGNFTDAGSYWKVPETSGNSATISIPIPYQPTSNITVTFRIATFGSGTNPSSSNTTITAVGTETNSNWTGSGVSTYPSSSTFVNGVMTINKPETPTTLGGLTITMGVNSGVKIFRLESIAVAYTYDGSGGGGGTATATLTQNNLELTGSYTTGTEKTIDGITYVYTDLMKSTDNIQAKASSGTIRNTTAYPGDITSVVITHSGTARATTINGSADGTNWHQVATGDGSVSANFSGLGYKYFQITRGSYAAYWTKIEITYSNDATPTCATPTFSPATGTYTEIQNVSITCATQGATIYYTLNGTDPTTSSSVYSEALSISETTTVKAMAVKADYNNSAVATATYTIVPPTVATPTFSPAAGTYNEAQSVTISCATDGANNQYKLTENGEWQDYTEALAINETTTVWAKATKEGMTDSEIATATYIIVLPLSTMQAIFDKATEVGSTATSVTIALQNWVVSGVSTNGKNVFVTDGTKGFVIFNSGANMGFAVGNILSGTVSCKVQLYNGFAELTQLNSSTEGISIATGGTVTVADIEMANLAGVNTGALVSYENLACSVDNSGSNTKYYLSDGTTQLQVYNSLYAFSALANGKTYNITGIYQQYNTTKEILPRSANDIEEVVLIEPTVTVTPSTVNAPATGAEGTLALTYENIEEFISFDYYFCDVEGNELEEDPYWIYAEIQEENDNYSLYYTIDANDGNARTAYFKVYTYVENGDDLEEVYAIVTVNQAKVDYATLPFYFDGGKADIEDTNGLTQNGLGSDYNSSPTLKFDGTGDWVILKINERPGTLTFDIKGNGFSGGTFTVQTSEDGVTYTDLETYTDFGTSGNDLKEEETFDNLGEDVRYIKWIYTEKSTGNVGLGNIALDEYVTPEPSITVTPATLNVDTAEHDGTLDLTYTSLAIYDMDDFDVQYYNAYGEEIEEPDWIEVQVAEQDPEIGEGYVVSYIIDESEGETRTAYFKVYAMGDNGYYVYSNLVTVTQAAPVIPYLFEYYVQDLVEGDYIIYYNGYAMKNEVSGNRLSYLTVTPSALEVIANSDPSIVWHIAPHGDYWTIYSADANAYAASNGTRNQAQMLADGTDDKALWTASGDFYREFVNKYNSDNDINANLRENDAYGFACYSTTTGEALKLYKKKEAATETYTLDIPPHQWCFIASPTRIAPANVNDLTDLYYYSEVEHYWKNKKNHDNFHGFDFDHGKGYLCAYHIEGEDNPITLNFIGTETLDGNTKEINLDCLDDSSLAGWNLVGNPFACKATLNMPCYTISGKAINTNANPANETQINPCEGVMVHATGEGQKVTFTKVADDAPAPQPNQLQLTVAQNVTSRGTTTSIVNDNAIVSFREGCQLEKFIFNADAAKLYIPQDNKEYAIVSSEAQGNLPVNFKATENGTYTLTVNPEGVEMNYLHLIDNMTGTDIDLLATPSYTFEARTTDYESRFKLVFVAGTSNDSDSFAFFSNGSYVISNPSTGSGPATLQVIDITGRILSSESINGSVSKTINAAPGVYMLRLINGNDVKVQKVVVK